MDPPGGGDGGDAGAHDDDNNMEGGRYGRDCHRDFTVVSPSEVVILMFSRTNVQNKFYMQFNKAGRNFNKAQGPKGVLLLDIPDDVEKYNAETYGNDNLEVFISQCPRAREYNTVIQTVLENYTIGAAEGSITYGVQNGFDAWRRLFHHRVPFAADSQQLFIYSYPTYIGVLNSVGAEAMAAQ